MNTIKSRALFSQVAEFCNRFSDHENEGGDYEAFLGEHGLRDVPHVFIATHSEAGREFGTFHENPEVPFLDDDIFSGGWQVFKDEDLIWLTFTSGTSGTSFDAQWTGGKQWEVTLEVPSQDGGETHYLGSYFATFMEIFGGFEVETDG